ncbi:MAG: branched-chain amino acid ABC transporter substrate-binding protein [Chloroflexi bacterium]|nr:branched-chain amino acid ABC transporter substrate-binding protein [Chloroflexota bacterium]
MNRKFLVIAALAIAVALVAVACGGIGGAGGGTIKIISSTPLTGGDSADGISMANSAKLALKNHGPKSGNYTLVLETLDDASAARGAWDGDVETSNANKAVADKSVLGYLGTYNSGAAKLSIPILNQAGPMVMVSGANTYAGLTKSLPGLTDADEPNKYYPTGVRNYARIVAPDDLQGAVGARWAKDRGVKSVYILDDQQLYGKGIADVYEKTATELGIKVVGHEGIDTKATDYSALATKIADLKPDSVYFGGVASSNPGLVWKALRSAGYKSELSGPDGMMSENFVKAAGQDAEGTLLTFAGLPLDKLDEISPEGKKWHEQYVKEFGQEPGVYGSYGYEAALVVLKAIDACVAKNDVTRKCVRDEVFNTKDFTGILGTKWSFDANGDTTVTVMTQNVIENGKFKYLGIAK